MAGPTTTKLDADLNLLKADHNRLGNEVAAFKARVDTLIAVARYLAGVATVLVGTGLWTIYRSGEIVSEVRNLSQRAAALESRVEKIDAKIDERAAALESRVGKID